MPDNNPPDIITTLEACALLGVRRHTLREWECRGLLTRLGKANIGKAVSVTYGRAAVLAAAERSRRAKVKPEKPEPPPAFVVPDGMLTAADVARLLGVKRHAINQMQREGKLCPVERVTPPQGGSAIRLYDESEVSAFAEVRDERGAERRIAALADAMRGGLTLGEALSECQVSRTTWNYWVRTRRDAAALNEIAVPLTRRPKPESRTRGPSVIGQVYFATGTGPRDPVKIGWTAVDPSKRLADLQVASPVQLRYLTIVRAHSPFEMWCHRQFESDRMYGEWFRRSPGLLRFVTRLDEIGDVTSLTPNELLALLRGEPLSLFGGNHGPTP
jgi:DNA-binding transcriptional MerR regulator